MSVAPEREPVAEVQWVDDPPPKQGGHEFRPVYGLDALDQLKANPDRWALLWHYDKKSPGQTAAHALVRRGFEAVTRSNKEAGGVDMYARWPKEVRKPTPIRPPKPQAQPGPSKAVGYPCDFCDEESPTPAALKHHVRRSHPEQAA